MGVSQQQEGIEDRKQALRSVRGCVGCRGPGTCIQGSEKAVGDQDRAPEIRNERSQRSLVVTRPGTDIDDGERAL